jgi:S1-C subfamily serine protease
MKTYVPISLAILVASLAVPEALGQQAQADLDNMPIFGMPANRKGTGGGIGNTGIPGIPHGPYLGIETQDIAPGRAGTPEAHGVKVTQVEAGSPASKAGFEIGDIVLDYQGHAVWGKARLSELLSEISVGHQVRFRVWRSGARLTLTANPGSYRGPPGRLAHPDQQS